MTVKIVAEISANHGGSLSKALDLIKMAASGGADYVKFQVFDPDKMATACCQAPKPWSGSLTQLYHRAVTPKKWVVSLFEYARQLGITPFASVFDFESLDFVASQKPSYIKIASLESTYWPLIKSASNTGIPLIISTGGMTAAELSDLDLNLLNGFMDVTFLACTASYPAHVSETKLGAIRQIKELTQRDVGLSDHTNSSVAAMLAVCCGATMIEKHIALDDSSLDSDFSCIGLAAFASFCESVRSVDKMLSNGIADQDQELSRFKRAIYAIDDIKQGDLLTEGNISILRGEGGGAHPRFWDILIHQRSTRAYTKSQGIAHDY